MQHQNRFSNISGSGGSSGMSRGSPGMHDEFADPLDGDYDSEIEYDDEVEEINYNGEISFKHDYDPLKFGVK